MPTETKKVINKIKYCIDRYEYDKQSTDNISYLTNLATNIQA